MAPKPISERDILLAIDTLAQRLLVLDRAEDLFWFLAQEVIAPLGFDDCVIYRSDQTRRVSTQVAAIGNKNSGDRDIRNRLTIPFGQGVTGFVVESGVPLLVDDVTLDPRYIPDIDLAGSEICVPFFIDGKVAGVIDCEAPEVGAFGTRHMEALSTLGVMLSAGLARLEEATKLADRNAALEISERRLALAMRGASDGLFDWDLTSDTTYYSPRWMEMLGYGPNDLPHHHATFLSLLHPDDADVITNHPAAMMAQGHETLESEFRLRHKEGHWVSVLSRAQMVREDGEVVRIVGTHVDITERKATEQRLRENARHFQEMLRVARLASWSVDAQGRLYWSREVFELLNLDPTKFDGTSQTFYSLVHPDDRARVKAASDHAWEHLDRYDCVHRMFDGEGTLLTVRESAEVVRDAQGNAVRLSGTIQDVTEISGLREKLEQAQKMEAIGQLTGGMAHDFNNLLGVIQGNAELLQEEVGSSAMLDALLRASQRGADLTRRLLAFARKQELRPDTVDLGALVMGMIPLMSRTLGQRVGVRAADLSGLWYVRADASQIENAVLNLALNARDAMPDGGEVEISCKNHVQEMDSTVDLAPGDYVRLSVSDTGGGMSPEVAERAFEPFFTTKPTGSGSGLGLSMIFGFTQQSGGQVKIESQIGEGTCVSMYLPRSVDAPQTVAPVAGDIPLGQGRRVLLVEDDPEMNVIVARQLRNLGYDPTQAGDAEQALRILQAQTAGEVPFEIVLSDVMLPGQMSGLDLADRVERDYPELSVQLMSGYYEEAQRDVEDQGDLERADRGRALLAGLLQKPFKGVDLARALRRKWRNNPKEDTGS